MGAVCGGGEYGAMRVVGLDLDVLKGNSAVLVLQKSIFIRLLPLIVRLAKSESIVASLENNICNLYQLEQVKKVDEKWSADKSKREEHRRWVEKQTRKPLPTPLYFKFISHPLTCPPR
jgi:hypothetical protein